MEFKIIGKYNETYLEECLILWKFSSKEALNGAKTYSIFCFVYLAFGLFYYLRGKSIPLFLDSLGLACFILLIIQLINIYELKTRTKKTLLARIDKYSTSLTAEREVLFTEYFVKYCDPEMQLELKWAAFSHYQEYGNYVFFLNESKKPELSIDKKNIPESIVKDLYELNNSKIPTKN